MDSQKIITADTSIPINNHFKIIAGPGAGKTRFLVNHIRIVLHHSNRLGRNKKIACITYTNIGVETIVDRLDEGVDHIEVCTIHSFLFTHVLKPFAFLIKSEHDIRVTKNMKPSEHLVSGYFDRTNLGTRHRLSNKELIQKIFWFIEGDFCKLHVRGKTVDMHADLYRYKKLLWEKGILHYDDVLALSWEILHNHPETLRVIRSKFPYIFVDEFQDTSSIQAEILKLIAEKETTLGVIGDSAQSIYSFQGADAEQFNNFLLLDMSVYKMKDNHRSTQEILNLLNKMRTDITQESPEQKKGNKPLLLVGEPFSVANYIRGLINSNDLYTLSYSNIAANSMRDKVEYVANISSLTIESILIDNDSNNNRRKVIASLMKAVEFARQKSYKEAIREVSRHLIDEDSQRQAISIIHGLLSSYSEYSSNPLIEFYEKIKALNIIHLPNFQRRKGAQTPAEHFYRTTKYAELALLIKNQEKVGFDRTIHQAKGCEFENVLVVVKPKPNQNYNESRDLGFLLNPDINNEEHRVYYVAASRAQKNLYFCVPYLSETGVNKIKNICEIEYL